MTFLQLLVCRTDPVGLLRSPGYASNRIRIINLPHLTRCCIPDNNRPWWNRTNLHTTRNDNTRQSRAHRLVGSMPYYVGTNNISERKRHKNNGTSLWDNCANFVRIWRDIQKMPKYAYFFANAAAPGSNPNRTASQYIVVDCANCANSSVERRHKNTFNSILGEMLSRSGFVAAVLLVCFFQVVLSDSNCSISKSSIDYANSISLKIFKKCVHSARNCSTNSNPL